MNAFVQPPAVKTTTQILAEAIEAAATNSVTHALTISETTTHPFVFDDESGVCFDADGNLCLAMAVKGTDISVYFKTAAHGEKHIDDFETVLALEPWNNHEVDTSYNAHVLEKDALCCVVHAESVYAPEGMIFRLTEEQAHRINEALAAYNVNNTDVVPHA